MYPNTTADDDRSASGTGSAGTGSAIASPQDSAPEDGDAAPEPVAPGVARPRRRNLIPRWLPWTLVAVLAVCAATAALLVWSSRTGLVSTPSVAGLTVDAATQRLREAGMVLKVGDRRFSSMVARGLVVEQRPAAGTELHLGSTVLVAVSAGSESLALPDVVGWTVERARTLLRSRGLDVQVEAAPSKHASGTVLSSYPAPGVTVSTGDAVRLTVATADLSGGLLLPVDLRGRSFVIDPAPMPVAGLTDAPMDVARRLRALFEASGATVVVTRDAAEVTGAPVELRAQRAKTTTSTALIGLSVIQGGAPGVAVLTVPADANTSAFFIDSMSLGTALVASLRATAPDVRTSPAAGDAILLGTGIPAVRVVLGSAASPVDVRSLSDPAWADSVARAVYSAMGSLYGAK
jgi:hypothetical protein